MSFATAHIHAVWGTKERHRVIQHDARSLLLDHIYENAHTKGIYIDCLNVQPEHVHCLFALNADMSISKAMQLIKGESSFWANRQKLISPRLEWAVDYFACAVSKSQMEKVRTYIRNQDEHHRKITFSEEYEAFLKAFGFTYKG